MRRLGQHFLKDKKVLTRIAESIRADSPKTIIEIGPGHGELTELLATGGKSCILAIERDKKLAGVLKTKFENNKNLELVEGDALKILPHLISSRRLPSGDYAVVGNIPYYITGFLFRTLGELTIKPKNIVLLIQKEVAERVCAKPPEMNRLAASVQFWGEPKILFSVPPGSFSPPPKVQSAVIQIVSKEKLAIKSEDYYQAVKLLFAQPRKTLLNNLASQLNKALAEDILTRLAVSPQSRPQNLSVSQIAKIAELLSSF